MKAGDLLARLSQEHKEILCELDLLKNAVSGGNVNFVGIWYFLDFTYEFAEPHHEKEEKILFPALEAAGVANQGGPIGVMLMEHGQKRALVAKLQKAFEEADQIETAKTAKQIIILLSNHIMKEEKVLYPLAKRLLRGKELAG